MGYITFGVICLQWFILTAIAVYILLYLDQEVLSELTNDMGGRAYRARTAALAAAGRASRPETEFSRGAYTSEKSGYQSPRLPGSDTSSARRMSRDYSEAEGGRGFGSSRRTDDGMSEKRRRDDDVEGRSADSDEARSARDEDADEQYYGAPVPPLVFLIEPWLIKGECRLRTRPRTGVERRRRTDDAGQLAKRRSVVREHA